MMLSYRLRQEFVFLSKSRAALSVLFTLFLASALSVTLGINYVAQEREQIAELIERDTQERAFKRGQAVDYGGAAYDAFHAAWNEPSALAFAAVGQRDLNPTMVRIRALAIEGQIYETDSVNPELALAGRFDFSFVVAYLLPLIVIFLFYDLISSERESGRLNLLSVTASSGRLLWLPRIALRVGGILLAALLPLWVGAVLEESAFNAVAALSLTVVSQCLFWTALVLFIAARPALRSEAIAAASVGCWLLLTLAVPIAGKTYIESRVSGAQGSEVALVQREAVNDAWDLPKAVTMDAFYASHPEWADSAPIGEEWHWKWYYAFQQVGDETAAQLAQDYRQSMLARDTLTASVALLSPAVAVQRALESLAETNLQANLGFEDEVRRYHETIRRAYYPVLFREVPFSRARLAQIDIPAFDE